MLLYLGIRTYCCPFKTMKDVPSSPAKCEQSCWVGEEYRVSDSQEYELAKLTRIFSVIAVPAIGAEAHKTWGGDQDESWLFDLGRKNSAINVLPYDHLYPDERRRELVALKADGSNKEEHNASIAHFKAAAKEVEQYGVVEWAERLYRVVTAHRDAHGTRDRQIIFICHSTGGSVVKAALSKQIEGKRSDLTRYCIAVTFMAVPHHGKHYISHRRCIIMTENRQ